MTNELTVVDQHELDAFAASVGANAEDMQGGNDFLPALKVNYNEEDANGKELKKGLFFLDNVDVKVYAKNVKIRPLLQYFQWTQYNKAEKKTINRTRFIPDFGQEARDEKGTVRCGKPTSKDIKANPSLKDKFDDITCYRHIYALVSYDGADADGVKHSVENVVCTIRLHGANFIPFQDEYVANMPKGSRIWDYEAKLGVTKEKNDPASATSFYVIHFDTDFGSKLTFDAPTFATLKGLREKVDMLNNDIDSKYYAALSNKTSSDAAINALDITPKDLGADLVDSEITF